MTTLIYTDHKDFLSNKYSQWYYSIIKNAQAIARSKGDIYYESHHILPKSIFPEFVNEKWNQVLLTAKEHFICHRLLKKFTKSIPHQKMSLAVWKMCCVNTDKMNITSRTYNEMKKGMMKGKNNPFYGKKHSQESIDRMRKTKLGKLLSQEHKDKIGKGGRGKVRSDESKKRYSESKSGEKNPYFEGYFITPWGRFTSANQAVIHCKHKVTVGSIKTWCQKGKTVHHLSVYYSEVLQTMDNIIGRSFNDIGFSFEPKVSTLGL